MPGSPPDLDVLTCAVLLPARGDNGWTIRAAWLSTYADRLRMDPGDVGALLVEAERRRSDLRSTWRAECEESARKWAETIIKIKVDLAMLTA